MTAFGNHKKRISKRSSAVPCIFLNVLQIASRSCDGLRFGSLLYKERSRMAKGTSPLRSFMRNAPRKTLADGIDGSSSGPDGTGAIAQSRQPLGPITEIVRNPLIAVADQSSGDPSTPRAKAKISSHGQEKFPHLENSEVHAISVNITPDKAASSQSKGKFTWQHRHGSTAQNTPRDGPPLLNTPPRPPKGSACSDGQAANNQETSQSLSHHLRGCSTGGGSVPSTPKTSRSVGGKFTTESENGGSQSKIATPCKSVSRSLKYSQQGSSNNSGASGLTNVRSTVSQHVVTRPMGHLQAGKGVHPQTTNQNFVEHHFELEEDASFWRDHNVQVIIRTRPLSNSELTSQGSSRCLKQESPHVVSWLGQPESRFTFDHVAGETITQAKLFDVAGLPMVENCLSGYNSCMFAYGQTGSGKTHTMLGDIENLDRSPSENRGMTPRVFEYLFGRIRTEQECRRLEHLKFFCKCSFLEIYNEQITDLLEPSSTNLQMREDAKKGVYVENLSEVEVQCVQDVIQLLLQGAANRKVAATNMNRESSRSHSVFTCVVESKWENNSMTNSRYGRLHLVDLAGSERQKSSGAEGGRLKEAANINKSLSTLGLVIMILVDVANGKQRHVPYRDSKLTFLLQDSLGGNSKTIMIANASPSSCCAMETLSTLKFAQRAKFIRNNAVINEDASGDVIALRQRIEELKVEVDRLRCENMSRVSSSRILALDNGSVALQKCGDTFDASTSDCNGIEAPTLDSRNGNISPTVSIANNDKQFRAIEAVLAGAFRREQQAEDITKKLAAEIEQLNRLVRQREEDSQCSKMMLRFREEKIRRLEGIADNVVSAEAFYDDERKNLIDELQLIRGRLDRNPELTRFAMENIRLLEELRRYEEFYDGGERDVLLEEMSGLRSQLLDMLDTTVGEQQTIGMLLTPQKRALAPEISALERENELLLIEVKSYQNEVKECRNNLNSCLVANADLSRQVDELQATVRQLKNERSQKHEESSELLESLDEEVPHRFLSRASHLVPQEATSSLVPTTAHIRLETEELDSQQRRALENVEEQVLELSNQLEEAQDLIQKLSSEVEQANELSDRRKPKENEVCIAEDDAVVREGLQDRWEKLQEVEMRHSEEITQLRMELDSMEKVVKEERQQRLIADQNIDDLSSQLSASVSKLEQVQRLAEDSSKEERQQRLAAEQESEELTSQLSAAVSKLEEAHCVVEALEGQHLFSINELENLQSEHTTLLRKMKEQDEGEVELQTQFQDENTLDDPAVSILEKKLLRTKRRKEEARRINRQFQQEKASRMALDQEREVTMSEVETQAALAITTLQSEILELREEVSIAAESEATAKLQISHLQKELETLRQTIGKLEDTNRYLSDKSDEYRNLVDEKHAQLRGLEADWESSASKLIDYLSDGDKALSEAVHEIEQTKIQETSQIVEKRQRAESVYHRLQGVQLMVRETEGEVRTLSDGEATLGETSNRTLEDGEATIRESEKKSIVAFLMVGELLETIRDLKAAQHRLVQETQQASLKEAPDDIQAAALQHHLEELRRQYGQLQDEHELVIREREDLRQENHTTSLELGSVNELKADHIRLEKELQESCRAIGDKDVENGNLHKQLNENHVQSSVMADRYQVLVAAHEKLQEAHARYLDDNALQAKEWEELIRLSEIKAMALVVVAEQLLGGRNDLKASNMGLAKEVQDGHLLLAEMQAALDNVEENFEQGSHQYKETADQYELLAETYENLQQEHGRLLSEKAVRLEEVEASLKLSERKAMAAFVVLDDLLERMKEFKTANSCLAKQIGEAHETLAEKDIALAALHNELSEYSDVARRHQVLEEAHENLRQDRERLLAEKATEVEEGEALVKLSERKAVAAFVVLDDLLERIKELRMTNSFLAKQNGEADVTLAEKDSALAALHRELSECSDIAGRHQVLQGANENLRQDYERLVQEHVLTAVDGDRAIKLSEKRAMATVVVLRQVLDGKKKLKEATERQEREIQKLQAVLAEENTKFVALELKLEQSGYESSKIAHKNHRLICAHDTLEEAHQNLRQEHESLLAEKALKVEQREASVKLSERKAMTAFVVLDDLLQRIKELKRTNTCLAKQIGDAHVTLAEKDTALAALHNELSEYSDVARRRQVLEEAHEKLREDHERLVTEKALRVEEGEALVKMSERKAMAAFVVLDDLRERINEHRTTNSCLAKQNGQAHTTLAEKDLALAALHNEVSEYSDVARRHQVLEEAHENLRQDHEKLLAEKALRVEEGEALVKLSERKAMAAFVVLDDLLESIKELRTTNSCLAKLNGEAHATLAGKDTALAALHNEVSEYSDVARRHQVLEEAHENLRQDYERLVQEHALTAVGGDRAIKLSEKRAMATAVILRQALDGNKNLKEETERHEREIQGAQAALAEKNIKFVALELKLEQSCYQSSEIADKYQILICAHDTLREQQERLQEELETTRVRQVTLEEEFVKGREEQERLQKKLEKEQEDYEGLQKELVKAQDNYWSCVGDNVFTADKREQIIKLSEKKAMGCLMLVEHLMETLNVLKVTKMKLEREIQEEHVAQSEQESRLQDLHRQLEESHASQKAICNENQFLFEKHGNLEKEHETCLGENCHLKQILEVLELGVRNHNAEVRLLQDESANAEQQCTEAYNEALSIVMKANSLHDMKFVESLEFMTNVRDGIELLCHEVSLVEAVVAQLGSVGRELGTCRSKVLMLEKENGGNMAAMEGYQTEISRLATTLQLKERDLDMTLEKETTSSKDWELERAKWVVDKEQSRLDCLESEQMLQTLHLEVQRLDSTAKESELRVSDMLTSVQALTVAKQELELQNSRLVLAARQAEMNFSEKEVQITAVRGELADVQAKLSAAELREQSTSERLEELTAATVEWETERAVVENGGQELREEMHRLRSQVDYLNFEMEKKEIVILEGFTRSLEALEVVEARMAAMEEELPRLEMSKSNLDHDMALLEAAASGDAFALEEKELECLEMKRQLGNVVIQINQMQTAIDLAAAQFALEMRNREAYKTGKEEEKCAHDIQPRDKSVSAELMFMSPQASLKTEVQRLDSSLKQTESRVSEMLNGVKALTVAAEELELEKCRLVLATSQAEMRCREKEQELFATNGELAGLRSRLTEAELHEKSLSGQMEELNGERIRWEVERADANRVIEKMRQEKDRRRFDLACVNAEVEEKERAIFDSFRRSQQALERVEARLSTVDQDLGWLEMSQRSLENDLAMLDSAATISSVALEETEHKNLEMQRQVENAELQMYEMQDAAESVMAQVVLEREYWEANKRGMKDENDARETELRDEIAAAELKLVATEGSLKFAVDNVEDLGLNIRALEEEILTLNEDAKISLSKVIGQQQQIDKLRGMSLALQAECTEADDSIAAVNQLKEQYILAEASWRSEQELLTRKLEELEVSIEHVNREKVRKAGDSESRGQLSQCLPECIPGSVHQKHFEEADQHSGQKQEILVLRAKISEKDRTIFSAKKEMQIAIANLKEAELEMEKVHHVNHRLTQMQLESKSIVESLSLKVKTAEEELLKRDIKIEGCVAELQKVVGIMSDWETEMHDVEIEWRKEKEALAQELTEAKLVAYEKRTEAAALLQKFQDGQATLQEAEDLVDALVKANEDAKHDALDWKSEKESLGIVQGWWMPERDKLVSKIARLETDMQTQKQDIWIMCKEAVSDLVATMDVLLAVDMELSELKSNHQQDTDRVAVEMRALKGDVVARLFDLERDMIKGFEDMQTVVNEMTSTKVRALKDRADLKLVQQDMDHLAVETKVLKGDMVARLLDLEGEMIKSFEDMQTVVYELTSEKYRALKDLADLKDLKEQGIAQSLQTMNSQLKAMENERDKYQTDLVVLNEQLEIAQTLADEREIVAAEARQATERSKSHADEKEEEARILERSVEELESTVYALESQLDIVKRESERQRVVGEALEKELEKGQKELMRVTIDSQDAQTVRDSQGAEASKTELDRIVIEMKNQQLQARQSVESLQQECAEKDVQLRSCKAHIAELMLGAEKQASENQLKLKSLEAMVEHLKMEERKVNPAGGSISKAVEKSTGKVKGAGSPFKCIGSSLEKQRSSEMDEDLSAAKKRIKELETVAASRQKEVFMLNTKLAEAESMTHDVVRDLLGVKMDIASYATLLNQQQVQRIAERARRRTMEAQQKEDELDTLRDRLNEFIEERESWLDEINRRQAEAVAARVSAEKLRLRDETLTTENDKLRKDCDARRKKVADLEGEIKKLSGQQNLQQRIHHHAKIKEENNSIRLQNEDLSGKLRRMEILFARVHDELARYRTVEGKSPFLNFDEEARLQKKLQETEENRLQLAETLIGLCTGIMQAAGIQRASRDLDPSAAMITLQQLQDRLESLERELSDCKLQARIAVEKRRLSDLRDFHTPVKAICTNTNFTANQQLPSPVSSSR